MNINRERGSLTDPKLRTGHITGTYKHCNGATYPVDYYIGTQYAYIADLYTPYGIGVWGYKPCFSVKVYHSVRGAMTSGRKCAAGQYNGGPQRLELPGWSWDGTRHPDAITLPVEQRIRLSNKVEAKLPSIGSGMPDLYVFLREFMDIKDTFKFLKEKALATKAAGAHLSYSFGIRPLLGDIHKILLNARNWRDRISRIKDGIGKVHDINTSVEWQELSDNSLTTSPCASRFIGNCSIGLNAHCPYQWNCVFANEEKTEHRLSQTLKYRYSWPAEADVIDNDVMGFLVANNLLPQRQSAWELLPFSFVLDWIANTDKVLGPLTEGMGFDCMTSIVDTCLTYKVRRTVRQASRLEANCFNNIPEAKTVEDYFYRWVGEDALDLLDWEFKLPNFAQFLLGGALVECLRH